MKPTKISDTQLPSLKERLLTSGLLFCRKKNKSYNETHILRRFYYGTEES